MTAEVADDLDAIRGHYVHTGPRCSVGMTLRAMAPDLRSLLERAADLAIAGTDRKVTWSTISAFLKGRDIEIADQTLSRHFRHGCGCWK